jgi:SAM-dependent methyltransferase
MDAAAWDEKYSSAELVWGIRPNRWVEQELGALPPGVALDLACGEGRNALWLAEQGWRVTGVDFSPVALEKARKLESRTGADVTWVCADVLSYRAEAPVHLALLCYLQVAQAERRQVMRAAAAAVAAGGTMLVVAHDSANLNGGTGGPPDPTVLYTADDVAADLDGCGLVVDVAAAVHRPVDGADRPAIDMLLRAHRPAE